MPEKWTLKRPIHPLPPSSEYTLTSIRLQWHPSAEVTITWTDDQKVNYEHTYRGPIAAQLLSVLPKANLSSKSLIKRIFEQLAADRVVVDGNVTGSPD